MKFFGNVINGREILKPLVINQLSDIINSEDIIDCLFSADKKEGDYYQGKLWVLTINALWILEFKYFELFGNENLPKRVEFYTLKSIDKFSLIYDDSYSYEKSYDGIEIFTNNEKIFLYKDKEMQIGKKEFNNFICQIMKQVVQIHK